MVLSEVVSKSVQQGSGEEFPSEKTGAETVRHVPVLLREVLDALAVPASGDGFALLLDATLGGGGHSQALLSKFNALFVIGIEQDGDSLSRAEKRLSSFAGRLFCLHGNFSQIEEHLASVPAELRERLRKFRTPFPRFDRILVDLGISSDQLDEHQRGFSFNSDAPLDMRMNQHSSRSAATLVNLSSYEELKCLFQEGGVGEASGALARAIVQDRPFTSTRALAEVCANVVRSFQRRRGKPATAKMKDRQRNPSGNPATVPFQAVRIAVNGELEVLKSFLAVIPRLLVPGGRAAFISFHSLEDQLVARAMRAWSRPVFAARHLAHPGRTGALGTLLHKHAVFAGEEEITGNPRARSARMRVFERNDTALDSTEHGRSLK